TRRSPLCSMAHQYDGTNTLRLLFASRQRGVFPVPALTPPHTPGKARRNWTAPQRVVTLGCERGSHMSSTAFTFHGQGSQAFGLRKDLTAAYPKTRAVLQKVDEAVVELRSADMFEGPEDILRLTENAQPALMAVSLAVIRVLEARGIHLRDHAKFVAGHSLGEYSALCAAGTFSLADAARLLRIRGQAMQKAVPVGHGAMAALLGLDLDTAKAVAAEAGQGEVCDVANDNAPGQVVVSGAIAAVERAVEIAKGKGAK